jgi:putative tributyrin esterase
MAHLRVDFFSDALALSTSMTVILPQQTSTQIGMSGQLAEGPPPVLYLLHGLSDDDTTWLRRTSIERYAAPLGLAVVMPQVHRSFYADETYGMKFWTYLSDELPRVVRGFFRVSPKPAETFVAGLSMGGYGAMKWALRQPERFAAAASFSGALDLAYIQEYDLRPHIRALTARVFAGRTVPHSDEDLFHLIRTADRSRLPALTVRCGTEDVLMAQNERFVATCRQRGVPVDAAFGPGAHEWGYWDEQIEAWIASLELKG